MKKIPFKLNFLMNDDVVTPTRMTGKKVLPILELEGAAMSESLDIVAKIDAIGAPILAKAAERKDIDQWLTDNKELIRTGWLLMVIDGCRWLQDLTFSGIGLTCLGPIQILISHRTVGVLSLSILPSFP